MMTMQSSGYRTASPPIEEPNPILDAWVRYRRAGALHNFALAFALIGGAVLYLASPETAFPPVLVAPVLLVLTFKRARRCRCPVCENPILGGPYQESWLGPWLGVFPRTCSYCDAEPIAAERAAPNWLLRVSLGGLLLVLLGVVFWRIDGSGERFTVRGVVLDPRDRATEVIVSTPRGDRKWDDGALRGRVRFTISIGRITKRTYVHERGVFWD